MAVAASAFGFDHIIQDNLKTNNESACPNGNQFIWVHLDQCLSTPLQWSSFGMGMLSIAIFAWVMIPQIIKNHKNMESIESISFGLLACWCCGDSMNFVGAVLTSQGVFQEVLGGWFVLVDLMLIIQVIYYHNCYKKQQAKEMKGMRNGSLILCLMGVLSLSAPLNRLMLGQTAPFTTDVRKSRMLLSTDDPSAGEPLVPFFTNTQELLGYIIGVLSAVFYAGSRTFQILKNKKYKKVAGLEPQTFILCIVGNILYGLAIFLYSLEKNYLIEHLPWIVGSWGIVMLDCFVIYQINVYKDIMEDALKQEVNVDTPSDTSSDEEAPLLNADYDQYGTLRRGYN